MSRIISLLAIFISLSGLNITTTDAHTTWADSDLNISISGHVTDATGQALSGVTVTGGGASTTTNSGGFFSLPNVSIAHGVILSFNKTGYLASTELLDVDTLSSCFKRKSKKYSKSGKHTPCDSVPSIYSVTKVMQAIGDTQKIDAALGGTVSSHGVNLTFPPGAINAYGQVDVIITNFDLTQSGLDAIPNVLNARRHYRRHEEMISVVNVTLTQGNEPVSLNDRSTIMAELPLQPEISIPDGESVAIKTYDNHYLSRHTTTQGVVTAASIQPGKLVIRTELHRLGWILAVRPANFHGCLSGVVKNADGLPLAGAEVTTSGISYNIGLDKTHTNTEGEYHLKVTPDSAVSIQAAFVTSDILMRSHNVIVETAHNNQFHHNSCQTAPVLTIGKNACVNGIVRDYSGNGIAGVTVSSSTGESTVTDVNGQYCMLIPADTNVNISALDYPATTVNAPAGSTCANGDCVKADLSPLPVPEPTPPDNTCVRGYVSHIFGFMLPNITIQAYDTTSTLSVGDSDTTDTSGTFTLTNVPVYTDIMITGGDTSCTATGYYNSGPAGNPADDTCLEVGGLICQ